MSVAYLAGAYPLFHVRDGVLLPEWLWTLSLDVLLPILLGIGLAFAHQKRLIYRLADLIGLKLFHHIPCAWDYTFENFAPGSFVIVRLKDGTQISGLLGEKSFISSTRDERDLLMEAVWNIDTSGNWTEAIPPRSILLCGGDIRWIEIL